MGDKGMAPMEGRIAKPEQRWAAAVVPPVSVIHSTAMLLAFFHKYYNIKFSQYCKVV